MKVSKVIKILTEMKDIYGDLDVNVSYYDDKTAKGGSSEIIYLRYEQNKDKDEISISTFPY